MWQENRRTSLPEGAQEGSQQFKKKHKTFHDDRFLFLKHFNLKTLKLGLNSDPF